MHSLHLALAEVEICFSGSGAANRLGCASLTLHRIQPLATITASGRGAAGGRVVHRIAPRFAM